MNYAIAVLAMVKAPHSGFDSSVKIHRLADLRLSELYKGCLGGGLRSHRASILAVIVLTDCLATVKPVLFAYLLFIPRSSRPWRLCENNGSRILEAIH